jgi:REP element-mobilizing transposase RayT
MSGIIHKEHNVSTLMHHIACPVKCRRAVINKEADKKFREICMGIEARYKMKLLKMGTEQGHACFLVQSVPVYSPDLIVRTIKSVMARKIFEECPEVKKCYGEVNSGQRGVMWGRQGSMRMGG